MALIMLLIAPRALQSNLPSKKRKLSRLKYGEKEKLTYMEETRKVIRSRTRVMMQTSFSRLPCFKKSRLIR